MKYLIIFICIMAGIDSMLKVIMNEPLTNKNAEIVGKKKIVRALAKHINIKEKRTENLNIKLQKAYIDVTPQEFIVEGLLKVLPVGLLDVFLLINGNFLLGLAILMASIFIFSMHFESLEKRMEVIKRKNIEELPEFASYLTNGLKTDRDIRSMVDNYIHAASPTFANELKLLSADLKTGNIDEALYNFDMRLNIAHLSNYISVVRALLNGEAQISNLETITDDMEIFEYETSKKYAEELPGKVSKAAFAVGASMMAFYLIMLFENLYIGWNQLKK